MKKMNVIALVVTLAWLIAPGYSQGSDKFGELGTYYEPESTPVLPSTNYGDVDPYNSPDLDLGYGSMQSPQNVGVSPYEPETLNSMPYNNYVNDNSPDSDNPYRTYNTPSSWQSQTVSPRSDSSQDLDRIGGQSSDYEPQASPEQ